MAFDDDRTTAINEKKRAARSSCPQWSWIGSHRCCSDNLNFRSKQQPDNDLHISPLLFEFDGWTQVYRDRDQFASLVREVAAPDVGRMGIEILSFTIKGKQMGCVCHLTVRPSLQLCYWTRLLILCCTILCQKKRCLRRCRVLVFAGQGADGQRQTRCGCRSRAGQPRRRNSGTNRNQTFNFLMGSHVYEFFYQLTLLFFSLTVSYFRLLKEKPKIVLAICILGEGGVYKLFAFWTECLVFSFRVW